LLAQIPTYMLYLVEATSPGLPDAIYIVGVTPAGDASVICKTPSKGGVLLFPS